MRERVGEEPEQALARGGDAVDRRGVAPRRLVEGAKPVAPEIGVELGQELVCQVRTVRVGDDRADRERDVEGEWLAARDHVTLFLEVALQGIAPGGRGVAEPGAREEGTGGDRGDREAARPSPAGEERRRDDADDEDERALAREQAEPAERAGQQARAARPVAPAGADQDERRERGEECQRRLGMEEHAEAKHDRVGDHERRRAENAVGTVGPELAGDQRRDGDEPGRRDEGEELPGRPGLALRERDRLVEAPERPEDKAGRTDEAHPGAGRDQAARRDGDEEQPEQARRHVGGELERPGGRRTNDAFETDGERLEERR